MELYVFQNELLVLNYKMYTVALDRKFYVNLSNATMYDMAWYAQGDVLHILCAITSDNELVSELYGTF